VNHFDPEKPTLFERFFAALFSAIAAGVTYAVWVFFNSGRWGPEQMQALQGIGKWIVLAGGVLGFVGGISRVIQLWAHLWDTTHQPLISLRTFLTLLVLASIGYGVYKLGPL
jgi:hypothetical protein